MQNDLRLPPEQSEYGFGLAIKLAYEKLAAMPDLPEQARRCEAELIEETREIRITYLNQTCIVSLADKEVFPENSQAALTLRDKILILHYLTQAKGTPPTGRLITYKELPDGTHYYPVFYKRTVKAIVSHFGNEPQRLLETAAANLGATRTEDGDMAVRISAFPKVPLTFVLWKGDEEFPPEGNILFDSNISDYLTNEDITILCEITAWKLVRLKSGR